ncbi:response regulator transcription factor, partial [Lacticaseibacillus rhamnosus]|uniref:response regulator transcription factor n=1 Tax=Lacticaseibacillus rhamnosus TaxID=47715 RepID=UPI00194F27BB
KIVGLELGADDYVTKPFSPREIIARIKAIERRSQSQPQTSQKPGNSDQITVGQIAIDPENYKASKGGKRLQLKPKEFELLVYFAQSVGKTLSRDALLNGVWG